MFGNRSQTISLELETFLTQRKSRQKRSLVPCPQAKGEPELFKRPLTEFTDSACGRKSVESVHQELTGLHVVQTLRNQRMNYPAEERDT